LCFFRWPAWPPGKSDFGLTGKRRVPIDRRALRELAPDESKNAITQPPCVSRPSLIRWRSKTFGDPRGVTYVDAQSYALRNPTPTHVNAGRVCGRRKNPRLASVLPRGPIADCMRKKSWEGREDRVVLPEDVIPKMAGRLWPRPLEERMFQM